MSNDHVPATDTGLPKEPKAVGDCQRAAVLLTGLIEGIDLLENEGLRHENARIAMTTLALERADQLANALDALEMAERRATA